MKLQKAIEIGEQYIRDDQFHDLDDFIEFVKLGIEAIKFRQRWEWQEGEPHFLLLPGETQE